MEVVRVRAVAVLGVGEEREGREEKWMSCEE
jgi:hypothetical protein